MAQPFPNQYYQPTLPPDPEWLAQAFLTPILASGFDCPVPVVTRLPIPAPNKPVLGPIMLVEAGDTHFLTGLFGAAYDTSFLMHSYSSNEDEAALISRTAIARVSAVQGITIAGWHVVDVCSVIGGRRLFDPEVPLGLVRYRSAVTWRVAGQPLT